MKPKKKKYKNNYISQPSGIYSRYEELVQNLIITSYHINRAKKNILIDAGKAFHKIQYPFNIFFKNSKLGIEKNFLNMIIDDLQKTYS